MRNEIKLGIYAVLIVIACVFGLLTKSSYKRIDDTSEAARASNSDGTTLKKDDEKQGPSGYGRLIGFGSVFFVSILGLGLMVGRDVSQYMGNRTLKALYNDDGEGISNPEYEMAEQEWANGHFLESIRMMREYLQKNPREQHVALRIAEIYEKDLANPLAAALEYEEVLKHKLPAERWGWAAIHLCNLYGKLNQQDKSVALLQRINVEYHQTAAAEKARKRLEDLGLPTETAPAQEASEPPPADTGPKLPPGFTLKKS